MDRVLVTGGAGYVGSHACKALAEAGFEPVAYDNLSRGHERLVRFGPLIRGDILDAGGVRAALTAVRPVACMHFAAFAYVPESVAEPALYWNNNVAGTLTLANALAHAGVKAFVFSSTCAVYGQPETLPIGEDAPLRPVSPYGRTKLVVEQMLADLEPATGLRSVCLRYFNACGADPGGEIGELHDPEPHAVPRALMAAAGVISQFDIMGGDYPTADGTAVRDYTHVSDLADAHVLALRYLLEGGASVRLNVGTGRGTSVREIVGAVERVTGRAVPGAVAPRRPGDPAAVFADVSRAADVLGFRARRTSVDEIVADAWRWHRRSGFGAKD